MLLVTSLPEVLTSKECWEVTWSWEQKAPSLHFKWQLAMLCCSWQMIFVQLSCFLNIIGVCWFFTPFISLTFAYGHRILTLELHYLRAVLLLSIWKKLMLLEETQSKQYVLGPVSFTFLGLSEEGRFIFCQSGQSRVFPRLSGWSNAAPVLVAYFRQSTVTNLLFKVSIRCLGCHRLW